MVDMLPGLDIDMLGPTLFFDVGNCCFGRVGEGCQKKSNWNRSRLRMGRSIGGMVSPSLIKKYWEGGHGPHVAANNRCEASIMRRQLVRTLSPTRTTTKPRPRCLGSDA